MTKPVPPVVASGYNMRTDENWWRFADGAVRCVDTTYRGRGSNYEPPDTPIAYIYRLGRDPYAGLKLK